MTNNIKVNDYIKKVINVEFMLIIGTDKQHIKVQGECEESIKYQCAILKTIPNSKLVLISKKAEYFFDGIEYYNDFSNGHNKDIRTK